MYTVQHRFILCYHDSLVLVSRSARRQRGVVESLSGWVFGQRLDDLSDDELQAEILYAEANLLLSFLTFLQVIYPSLLHTLTFPFPFHTFIVPFPFHTVSFPTVHTMLY